MMRIYYILHTHENRSFDLYLTTLFKSSVKNRKSIKKNIYFDFPVEKTVAFLNKYIYISFFV